MKSAVIFEDLGRADYQTAWDYQEKLFRETIDQKITNRAHPDAQTATRNYLLFCEHPHVYTLGKSGHQSNLLLNEQGLRQHNAKFYKINRGGDITYHGPGQIVGYPILDLDHFFTDIHQYLRFLEEAVIRTLNEYGIKGERLPGYTGVWLDAGDDKKARKICALGVKCSRWVTMHGFAFNVNTDLTYFKHIIPCGIDDKSVTSMAAELNSPVDINQVKDKLKQHLCDIFEWELTQKP